MMGFCLSASLTLSVVPLPRALGISASDCEMKMFLPEPSYLISSVAANCCRWRVGSRLCGGRVFFPGADPETWRCPGRGSGFNWVAWGSAGIEVEAIVDEGMS